MTVVLNPGSVEESCESGEEFTNSGQTTVHWNSSAVFEGSRKKHNFNQTTS